MTVVDTNGAAVHATVGSDPEGNLPTPNDTFRIGSITKVFTSLLTLKLVDAGGGALVTEYVTRVPVPNGVTVRDLLQHTSGIPNFNEMPGFWSTMADDRLRVWSPESVMDLVEGWEPLFEPGAEYSYSNTNYLILGVLIEEVTGRTFAEEMRARIVGPLGLGSTYLAGFEEGPAPFWAHTTLNGVSAPIDFDYTSIATAYWAAGAMVSSVKDLHVLLSAVFDGHVISPESLAAMTGNDFYGYGIIKADFPEPVYAHGGEYRDTTRSWPMLR